MVDATTGQNGLRQAQTFAEAVEVTGVVLTKLDGTAKGGIALAISQRAGYPGEADRRGEGIEDLRPFDAREFAASLAPRTPPLRATDPVLGRTQAETPPAGGHPP